MNNKGDYIYTLYGLNTRGPVDELTRFENLADCLKPGDYWEWLAFSSIYGELDERARENAADYSDCQFSHSVIIRGHINNKEELLDSEENYGTLYRLNCETGMFDQIVSNIAPVEEPDRFLGRFFMTSFVGDRKTEDGFETWNQSIGIFDSVEKAKEYIMDSVISDVDDELYSYVEIEEVPSEIIYPDVFAIDISLYRIEDGQLSWVDISREVDDTTKEGRVIGYVRQTKRLYGSKGGDIEDDDVQEEMEDVFDEIEYVDEDFPDDDYEPDKWPPGMPVTG